MSAPGNTHGFQALAYRPEIDGLRALAVIAVVLFHAPLGCPGGYVGVDVFFVISGFLITSLVLRDLEAGRFSLAGFWERRIRRILPALSAMIFVTMAVSGVMYLSEDFEQFGKSVIAQALLAANFFFWRSDEDRGGYFGPTSEERPLLHTWSLAVEEQFYLIFPVLMLLLFRFSRLRQAGALGRVLGVGVIGGLLLAETGVRYDPAASFYLLPTRAWELLTGAWLAALPAGFTIRRRFWREAFSWLGLAGIVIPFWLYSKETPFPGLAALPPCVGTALVILGNTRGEGAGLTSAGRMLAWQPVVFIGLISYSLYLWHWPVLVLGKYWWVDPVTPLHFRIGLVLLALVLAVLSWRFVETPFRKKKWMTTRKSAFRFAGAVTLASVVLGAVLDLSEGLPARLPERVARQDQAAGDKLGGRVDVKPEDVRQDRLYVLGAEKGSTLPPQLLLWGDSHARHAIPAADALCRELGIAGRAAVSAATAPVLGASFGFESETPYLAAEVLDYIERHRIPRVILAARWSMYEEADAALLEKSLTETIRVLHAGGRRVWIVRSIPGIGMEAPKALAMKELFGREYDFWKETVEGHRNKNRTMDRLAGEELPAVFLDPAPLFLEAGSDRYRVEIDGLSIYYDDDHLTNTASRLLLLPLLRNGLKEPPGGLHFPEGAVR